MLGGLVAAMAFVASGCAGSPEHQAAGDLAATVSIHGYRKLSARYKGDTRLVDFAGPPGVDLSRAVRAEGWSPQPPPSRPPAPGAYTRVATGMVSSAKFAKFQCEINVYTLRPGYEKVATELNDHEQQELADGRLVYVQVACDC